MSNYFEYKDKLAFHPGSYIQEIIEDRGMTQEDFAKRLGTTPKTVSELVNGDISLSVDMAIKLSRLTDTSLEYWLNLQCAYDAIKAQKQSDEELELEREVFKCIEYGHFVTKYNLPACTQQIDEQIGHLRTLLGISSLSLLTRKDLAANFRGVKDGITEENTIKANIMLQIAINKALETESVKFNKEKFRKAAEYAATMTENHTDIFDELKILFKEAGVIFVMLPNVPGAKINGATKKVGPKRVLMVNDRTGYADVFWFTLFHEIGHILNGDFGVSFDNATDQQEDLANEYARNMLVPKGPYDNYIKKGNFSRDAIIDFASQIDRDPGIIAGRLISDGFVTENNISVNSLRPKYDIIV